MNHLRVFASEEQNFFSKVPYVLYACIHSAEYDNTARIGKNEIFKVQLPNYIATCQTCNNIIATCKHYLELHAYIHYLPSVTGTIQG